MKRILFVILSSLPCLLLADNSAGATTEQGTAWLLFSVFGILALALLGQKISSLLNVPAVLGQIGVGLVVAALGLFGFHWNHEVHSNNILLFLFDVLAACILLFKVGLETNLDDLKKVAGSGFWVAVLGVIAPFAMGYLFGVAIGWTTMNSIFIGATLTATSVGVTAKVFTELGIQKSRTAQIVVAAAVIDDVLGLFILAIVRSVAETNSMEMIPLLVLFLKATVFLGFAFIAGPHIGKLWVSFVGKLDRGISTKVIAMIGLMVIFAAIALLVGLAPIVGAFAAGVALDHVLFDNFEKDELLIATQTSNDDGVIEARAKHEKHGLEHLLVPFESVFVGGFFVVTGMAADFSSITLQALWIAIALSVIAIVGKVIAGLVAKGADRFIVGVGMVARGEVGIIFLGIGKTLGVLDDTVFAAGLLVIMVSTVIPPLLISYVLKKRKLKE